MNSLWPRRIIPAFGFFLETLDSSWWPQGGDHAIVSKKEWNDQMHDHNGPEARKTYSFMNEKLLPRRELLKRTAAFPWTIHTSSTKKMMFLFLLQELAYNQQKVIIKIIASSWGTESFSLITAWDSIFSRKPRILSIDSWAEDRNLGCYGSTGLENDQVSMRFNLISLFKRIACWSFSCGTHLWKHWPAITKRFLLRANWRFHRSRKNITNMSTNIPKTLKRESLWVRGWHVGA